MLIKGGRSAKSLIPPNTIEAAAIVSSAASAPKEPPIVLVNKRAQIQNIGIRRREEIVFKANICQNDDRLSRGAD